MPKVRTASHFFRNYRTKINSTATKRCTYSHPSSHRKTLFSRRFLTRYTVHAKECGSWRRNFTFPRSTIAPHGRPSLTRTPNGPVPFVFHSGRSGTPSPDDPASHQTATLCTLPTCGSHADTCLCGAPFWPVCETKRRRPSRTACKKWSPSIAKD